MGPKVKQDSMSLFSALDLFNSFIISSQRDWRHCCRLVRFTTGMSGVRSSIHYDYFQVSFILIDKGI